MYVPSSFITIVPPAADTWSKLSTVNAFPSASSSLVNTLPPTGVSINVLLMSLTAVTVFGK